CLAASLVLGPGCILGSPVAAFSGEPYGMTRDDASAIGGEHWPIWGGHPVMAAIDIPFAAVLDTAFLPFALIFWGITAIGDDGGDGGHDHEHDHGDGEYDHHHGDGEYDHAH